MTVLKNCRLVPELTEGYDDEIADVVIDESRIVEIRSPGISSAGDPEVIDARGATLLPGLFDIHAHLYSTCFNEAIIAAMDPGRLTLGAYEFARSYLRRGFTTLRDCGTPFNAAATVRNVIRAGSLPGPRIITCGLIITPTETGNETFGNLYREADGPENIRKACREELKKGNDFIKLMVSGAFMNEGGDPGRRITTDEEIVTAVKAAEMKGTYVCGHCHSADSIKAAIRAGVRTIEHGVFIDDEGIALLKDHPDRYLVPTGAVTLFCLQSEGEGVSEELKEKNRLYAELERERVHAAYEAGLVLGFGSDIDMVSFNTVPGYECIARKEYYGFRDLDILLQATKNSARILGLEDRLGTIGEGKLASLVLVDGKPDENIYAMTRKPLHVFMEGRKVSLD